MSDNVSRNSDWLAPEVEEVSSLVYSAQMKLLNGKIEEAGECLARALEIVRKVTGGRHLGLPRDVDSGGEHSFGLQNGALWAFDHEGWQGLMKRIAKGRGYSLCDYGVCLTLDATDLSKMSRENAERELDD